MELLGYIVPLAAEAAEHGGEESGGSFLVSPGLGLMIWTLVLFLITMWVLSKVAFPKIQEALARLAEAREQADDIMARARKSAETAEAEAAAAGKEKREELVAAAKRDIEAETRRSLDQIRQEVADLTVLATERVTRKSLSSDDQKRLVEEALAEVDFSALSGAEKN
jgi:F-type H+-transporting ATPase subunit b